MTRPGRRPSDPPYLHSVYGAIIDQVKSHKLLGIHLDQDLDFDIQTEVLCKSFSKKIGFLKHISPYFERSHKLLYYDAVHCIYVLHIVRFLILTLKTRHTWKPSIWFQASFSCCILWKGSKTSSACNARHLSSWSCLPGYTSCNYLLKQILFEKSFLFSMISMLLKRRKLSLHHMLPACLI